MRFKLGERRDASRGKMPARGSRNGLCRLLDGAWMPFPKHRQQHARLGDVLQGFRAALRSQLRDEQLVQCEALRQRESYCAAALASEEHGFLGVTEQVLQVWQRRRMRSKFGHGDDADFPC